MSTKAGQARVFRHAWKVPVTMSTRTDVSASGENRATAAIRSGTGGPCRTEEHQPDEHAQTAEPHRSRDQVQHVR